MKTDVRRFHPRCALYHPFYSLFIRTFCSAHVLRKQKKKTRPQSELSTTLQVFRRKLAIKREDVFTAVHTTMLLRKSTIQTLGRTCVPTDKGLARCI